MNVLITSVSSTFYLSCIMLIISNNYLSTLYPVVSAELQSRVIVNVVAINRYIAWCLRTARYST